MLKLSGQSRLTCRCASVERESVISISFSLVSIGAFVRLEYSVSMYECSLLYLVCYHLLVCVYVRVYDAVQVRNKLCIAESV